MDNVKIVYPTDSVCARGGVKIKLMVVFIFYSTKQGQESINFKYSLDRVQL